MPWWVSLYGVCITALSTLSVIAMARSCRLMRRYCDQMSAVTTHVSLAASDMWDKLTPEQIRQLHPNTVDVGNGLPTWDTFSEAMKSTTESE